MGRAESCDSAAEDRHSLLHFVILRQTIDADSGGSTKQPLPEELSPAISDGS
jgi:hypothetical protein